MSITTRQFNQLKIFPTVSFALWDTDITNIRRIKHNLSKLHDKIIILGLNPSAGIKFLKNFHSRKSGTRDSWYKEAFSKKPFIGAYMTDVSSYPEVSAQKFLKKWRTDKNFREKNLNSLKKQLDILGSKNRIVLFIGKNNYEECFKKFKVEFGYISSKDNVFYVKHPNSYRMKNARQKFLRDVQKISNKL